MSRSGYTEDCDTDWSWVMWRGAVASALRGKRGQAFLREMLTTLDDMPQKRLVAHDLIRPAPAFIPPEVAAARLPAVCAIGAVGMRRGIEMDAIDPEDTITVANAFGVSRAFAAEVVYVNDEGGAYRETPEERWVRMRAWIASQLQETAP